MDATPVLRLFRFHPAHGAFDAVLRETVVPDLAVLPGIRYVYSGRQGPEQQGWRLVATVWDDEAAMGAALGATLDQVRFHPEFLVDTEDRSLEVVPLRGMRVVDEEATPATILRLARGEVRTGEFEAYVEEALASAEADAIAGHGPLAFFLAQASDHAFVTLSVWGSWGDIERATGGDIHRPIATRQAERLVAWDAEHYEMLLA